jgi:hypothetical protein
MFNMIFSKIVPVMRHATEDNTIRRMRFACWVNKATDTHSEYVILTAFLPQKRQSGHASIKRYSYISRLVVCLGRNHICRFTNLPFHTKPMSLQFIDCLFDSV